MMMIFADVIVIQTAHLLKIVVKRVFLLSCFFRKIRIANAVIIIERKVSYFIKNTELAEYKEEYLRCNKSRIYHASIHMYRQGLSIKSIVNKLYPQFHSLDKTFTKSIVNDYVWKSIYDFVMKEKAAGD